MSMGSPHVLLHIWPQGTACCLGVSCHLVGHCLLSHMSSLQGCWLCKLALTLGPKMQSNIGIVLLPGYASALHTELLGH